MGDFQTFCSNWTGLKIRYFFVKKEQHCQIENCDKRIKEYKRFEIFAGLCIRPVTVTT